MDPALLVLQRPYARVPKPPELLPFGRAALELAERGLPVLFGHEVVDGHASGLVARPGGWRRVEQSPIRAVFDRLAGEPWRELRSSLLQALPDVPLANPPRVRELCRDKLCCQRHLEAAGLPTPPALAQPGRFAETLARWGVAYLKPRTGSRGLGVRRVTAGVHDISDEADDLVLQRAVQPEEGHPPVTLRVLAQRDAAGTWVIEEPVARIGSPGDAVVSVHGGAQARPAGEVCDEAAVRELALCTARSIAGGPDSELVLELGVDFVLDRERRPWIIEVNSVPRGHLASLAEADPARWAQRHVATCRRPLEVLASLTS